ncbi:MAG: 4-hydroxythreonine-4-phosphate dehydrogenase PdxA [Pseudomonadota bacterium]|jgi:4-hydroxythreonine-4-phosphate dehydrogenase|nr:4-hydroxythreonine-4-phosphate dehydrogenase PdxA [Pseudomonadota bacterium]MEC9192946.1 4-hydroxythreonine-4-phosphate dehydrogenase PdxA [Pseudomonadota bacterium]|tara:strand:- start:33 stop:977 length:945 start_codon:yes stop_codon:yes gene_type:complete
MTKFFISPGDPAGIGPEVTLKALSKNKKIQNNFILAGDKNLYQNLISQNNLDLNLIEEDSDEEGVIFKHFPLKNNVSIGNPDVGNANYIIDILSHGALGCLKNEFKGLITGPINKELINQSGFEFSGHTEFLADIANVKKVVMLLMNKKLKIALLTTHIPLSEVPSKISKKNLENTISIISDEFENTWKIKNPSICLLGLNPHAGEGGYIGHEEEEILKPFVNSSPKNVFGPISADTAFIEENINKYDVFLAMYHDQGLPVIKSMGFGNTLNVTMGLPFIRISVDHGTAYEIAGKNKADFSSMDEALKTSFSLL